MSSRDDNDRSAEPLRRRVYHLIGYPVKVGGIIPSVTACAVELKKYGFQGHMVMQSDFPGGRVDGMPVLKDAEIAGDLGSHARLLAAATRFAFRSPIIRQMAPDTILHGHSRCGMLICYLAALRYRRPVVVTPHAYGRRRWLYRLGRFSSNVRWVMLTRHMRGYYGLGGDRAVVISEACDLRFLTAAVKREAKPAFENGPLRMVGLGTLGPRKRWHILLEALAKLTVELRRQLVVDIYGSASGDPAGREYVGQLESMINRHRLEETVRLRGATSDVLGKLLEADWFLLPSSMEPCSVALIEAMATGCPAIVADDGGSPEVVSEPEGGFTFIPDNAADLARILSQVLANGSHRPSPSQVSQLVRHRMADAVAEAHARLYRTC